MSTPYHAPAFSWSDHVTPSVDVAKYHASSMGATKRLTGRQKQ